MEIIDKDIKRIANSDMRAFEKFFEAFYPSLSKFCFEYLKSYDLAADVAQESMIKFWDNRTTHKAVGAAKMYLYTTARNLSISIIRHNKVVMKHEASQKEGNLFFLNTILEEEVYELLHKEIDKLPEQTHNIIKLALKGLKNNEIAEQLNVSINTIKSLKKAAYRNLRLALKDHVYALAVLYIVLYA